MNWIWNSFGQNTRQVRYNDVKISAVKDKRSQQEQLFRDAKTAAQANNTRRLYDITTTLSGENQHQTLQIIRDKNGKEYLDKEQ